MRLRLGTTFHPSYGDRLTNSRPNSITQYAGKPLIRRAIDGPRQKRAGVLLLQDPGGALGGQTTAEQPEHGRPAAGHRRMRGARLAQRSDNPRDLRMVGGDGAL